MFISDQLLPLLFLPFLYAETHYRFKYFFSWIKKSEPEIIADIPYRVIKGKQLPVLLIVKDSNKYKVEIIELSVFNNNEILFTQKINLALSQIYFDRIFFIDTSQLKIGKQFIDVAIKYKIENKISICHNDNHRGTKHKPLPVYITDEPLPKFEHCIYGETHCHTNFTSDQLEFGASVKSTSILAKTLGLSFFCATDHSYDLDDNENNYLQNDINIPKWKKLLNEINSFNNSNQNFKVIIGEEASLHNHKNRNIHCLIYNSEKFYPGNGDSGEKWLHPFSELTIDNVLSDVDKQSLVFAAHPVEPVPLLQRLLIRRDNWHIEDCRNMRLNGLQFANGGPQKYLEKGKKLWIKLLLEGQYLVGIGGNDAHGNFARYRQVSFPFIAMEENYFHLFGVWRTGVYLTSPELNITAILNSIKSGNCFITNGPALQFQAISENNIKEMGSKNKNIDELLIKAKSSSEFGKITQYTIYHGIIGEKTEVKILQNKTEKLDLEIKFPPEFLDQSGYYRCEIKTDQNKLALSNPIWYSIG